jgi:hypothetical protein
MVTVLVFLAVALMLIAVSQRQLASMLRVERARTQVELCDQGPLLALAQALQLLETGLPPTDPYVGETTVDTPLGERSYTVTFTSAGPDQWNVDAVPTSGLPPAPLPPTFAP